MNSSFFKITVYTYHFKFCLDQLFPFPLFPRHGPDSVGDGDERVDGRRTRQAAEASRRLRR